MSRDSRPTFIDLFAGCGGFSLGFCKAGWRGVFAVEKDPSAFKTFRENFLDGPGHNRFSWPSWLEQQAWDIRTVLREHRDRLESLEGQITAVIGGPPCQGFSFAGARSASDPRNELFRAYVEFVSIVKPRFILIENVGGIRVKHGKKSGKNPKAYGATAQSYAEKIIGSLRDANYCPSEQLVASWRFGVPQLRPRVIFYAHRREGRPPTSDFFDVLKQIRPAFLKKNRLPANRPVWVREAISDLLKEHGTEPCTDGESPAGFHQGVYGPAESAFQRLLRKGARTGLPPSSHRFVKHRAPTTKRFKYIQKYCTPGVQLNAANRAILSISKHVVVPLRGDQVGHTLTTLPDDYIHYDEPRILTPREYARLQTFPDTFVLRGPFTTGGQRRKLECPRYTQIGNAVPPLLGEALGLALKRLQKRRR